VSDPHSASNNQFIGNSTFASTVCMHSASHYPAVQSGIGTGTGTASSWWQSLTGTAQTLGSHAMMHRPTPCKATHTHTWWHTNTSSSSSQLHRGQIALCPVQSRTKAGWHLKSNACTRCSRGYTYAKVCAWGEGGVVTQPFTRQQPYSQPTWRRAEMQH
jgi:hypothetical protein